MDPCTSRITLYVMVSGYFHTPSFYLLCHQVDMSSSRAYHQVKLVIKWSMSASGACHQVELSAFRLEAGMHSQDVTATTTHYTKKRGTQLLHDPSSCAHSDCQKRCTTAVITARAIRRKRVVIA